MASGTGPRTTKANTTIDALHGRQMSKRYVWATTGLIADEHDSLEWQRKSAADVERLHERVDAPEIVAAAVVIAYAQGQVVDTVHHGRLKDVLQELVIDNCSAGLNLKYNKSRRRSTRQH